MIRRIRYCRYQGDTSISRFYPGLKRFMDNEIHRATANSTLGLHNMFATFGDWIWLPGSTSGAKNVVPGGIETDTDIHLTASFSFVHDLEHMAQIATHLGVAADARRYSSMLAEMTVAWHNTWYLLLAEAYYGRRLATHQLARQNGP